ncbi:Cell wall teichoic acid glycosylation protein gtcA [Furfurilactobacillus rossiae]|uniref:GtrA family protein n=1 Tax=Furfurilactobacillus rossiae TaxID=231049 RepID=UPI0015BFCAB3|nr:GtrA family protein [Furfurilactobacillus rossiae]QLE63709.1 Cell wall teichoic acid glycosylation protein gtcA [Furfurilactobacillus rossiae]
MFIKTWCQKHQSIIEYVVWGTCAFLINLSVFTILDVWTPMNYQVANAIGWFLATTFAFCTNKLWVFATHASTFKSLMKEMWSFYFFRVVTLLMDIIILFIGISLLKGNDIFVKLIDQCITNIANYAFSRWYIFKTVN